jgi:hypothetical protein
MQLISQWFSQAIDRLERVRFIEEALLTRRYARYAVFRLRYFFGIALAEAAVHIIEFTILAFIFTRQTLVLAILARAVGILASAWWWGALESMRGEIRALRRAGKSHLIDAVASKWLCLALLVAVVLFLAVFGWIVLDISRPTGRFTVFHLLLLAIGVQLALSILSRTYHSIVYAVRRVYRPFMAILGVRLFTFVGTLIFWPILGLWSFPMMLLATSVLASMLTFHYVRRMYRTLGLRRLRIALSLRSLKLVRLLVRPETWLAGCAYVVLRLDTLIILLLFPHAYSDPDDYNLFLFFYLIAPLVHSSYGWAQLFYFDLKRLESGLLVKLKRDFDRFVRRLSWWVGGLVGSIASAIGTLLVGRNLGMLYIPLALFFLFRSRLAFSQVRFFTEHRYGALIALGGALIAAMLYAQWGIPGEAERFGFYAAALVVGMLCMTPIALRPLGRAARGGVVSLPDWVARVRSVNEPVRIRGVRFAKNVSELQITEIARRVGASVGAAGEMARVGSRQVSWFEIGRATGTPSDESLLTWSGGLVLSLRRTEMAETGADAFVAAQRAGIIDGRVLPLAVAGRSMYDVPRLLERFKRMFPDGSVFDLEESRLRREKILSASELRDIMFNAIQYCKDFSPPRRRSAFDVSTLLINGEIRIIFAIPARIMPKARRRWRELINRTNLAIASGTKIEL